MTDFHTKNMKRAIALAAKGVGKTRPNPAVGCVIVQGGEIVGEGWHKQAGSPHAEVHALQQAGNKACGADVYVTLEPCAHFGKTPPCADALVNAGVGRVFVGLVDPNPKVCGKGIERLVGAGIAVTTGLLERDCRRLIEPFIKHVTTGLPFVILKSALTLDGRTATASGDARWITSEQSRRYVHQLRSRVDAIMVGVGTVLADDPQLTSRLPRGGRDPLRVIVDSNLRTPATAQVLQLQSAAKTVIATTVQGEADIGQFTSQGAEIIHCRAQGGRVDLMDLLQKLGAMGVQSVLLEGGAELAGAALRLGIIDKVLLFYAPKLVGGDGPGLFAGQGVARMVDALLLKDLQVKRLGADILLEGYLESPCLPV